jgi:hypothetical protein
MNLEWNCYVTTKKLFEKIQNELALSLSILVAPLRDSEKLQEPADGQIGCQFFSYRLDDDDVWETVGAA